MPPDEPRWWYATDRRGNLTRRALVPIAKMWGAIAERRFRRAANYRASLPVICVGNFTAGGTGKTPLAIAIAEELTKLGHKPAFLTRGYRGRRTSPTWVDANRDTVSDVGDEALLLAQHAPTLVARNRKAGARTIETSRREIDCIVMDDGLQNGSLHKDLTIALIDAQRGFGNGEVIPAGPLRAPLPFQLEIVDCIVINRGSEGTIESPVETRLRQIFPGPVLTATIEPKDDPAWLASLRVHAYAGIANPERFFLQLERHGARVTARTIYPDHHVFTETDAEVLVTSVDMSGAMLVTTEKDYVRLKKTEGALAKLRERSQTLPIRIAFEDREIERLRGLVATALKDRS